MLNNIHGDKGRYMQCFLNFLSNAVKFSKPNQNIIVRLTLLEAQKLN